MGFLDSLLTGAGALLGGISSSKGTDTGTKTTTNEPWAEAAPWLKQNIATGQNLQNYYQQNPFNQVQQTAYQNLLGDQDSFRSGALPGLMNFSNQLMSSNYQRAPSAFNPTGLGAATPAASGGTPTPLQAAQSTPTTQNVFQAPAGQGYGTIDFNALNPFKNELAPQTATPSATPGGVVQGISPLVGKILAGTGAAGFGQPTAEQSALWKAIDGGGMFGDTMGQSTATGSIGDIGGLLGSLGVTGANAGNIGSVLGALAGGPLGGLLGSALADALMGGLSSGSGGDGYGGLGDRGPGGSSGEAGAAAAGANASGPGGY